MPAPRKLAVPATALVAVAVSALVAGCGQATPAGPGSAVTLTTGYGASVTKPATTTPMRAGLTAMRQLQSVAQVETSYGGRFVTSIDGAKADGPGGTDWLYYVDGTQPDIGAAAWRLKPGEVVQWDLHQWRDVTTPEAIVGAFPRPLTTRGVTIVCKPAGSAACKTVSARFTKHGPVKLVVGPWDAIAGTDGVPDLSKSPVDSGALAGVAGQPGARKLVLLGADGKAGPQLAAPAGLIVAGRQGTHVTWTITGTDAAGVDAAVKQLDAAQLKNRFALAADANGPVTLPVQQAKARP